MFERFTDRARRVVALSQEEARMYKHNYVGTEHVLLALIREGEGVAAKSLLRLGVNLLQVRNQIETIKGQGKEEIKGHIPFNTRAKRVLELSLREALQLGHNYIGTEHILLGLIREGDGMGAKILKELLGEDALSRARRSVTILLSGYVGTTLEELDKQIAEVRHQKEVAIDAYEFDLASSLRDTEKELVNQRAKRLAPRPLSQTIVGSQIEGLTLAAGAGGSGSGSRVDKVTTGLDEQEFEKFKQSLRYKVEDIFNREQPMYYPLKWDGRRLVGIDWENGVYPHEK